MSAIPKNPPFTLEELSHRFKYDPDTGHFIWRISKARMKAGERAGYENSKDRHRRIEYCGRAILESRLAWLFTHGNWPDAEIDHIDRNPSNNAIRNLREVTRFGNIQNQATKNGYWFDAKLGKFRSEIRTNSRRIYLGCFNTSEEARAAYDAARRKHHPTFVSMERQSL